RSCASSASTSAAAGEASPRSPRRAARNRTGSPRRLLRHATSSRRDDARVKVLALDYGSVRTGVAVSDPTGTLARPLGIVERAATKDGLAELERLDRGGGGRAHSRRLAV